MKRIMLHVIILMMAVVSMVCAGKAIVIEEIEYHGMTSEEAKSIYIEHYASGIQQILGKFYVEMNGKKLLGKSRDAKFQEITFDDSQNWIFEETGFLYCVSKGDEIENIVTNMDVRDSIKGVAVSFNRNGFGVYGNDKDEFDMQMFETMNNKMFENVSSFYYYADIMDEQGNVIESRRMVISYDDLKEFCKDNQLSFIMQINDDFSRTYFGQLKQSIEKNITQKDIEASRDRALIYVFVCGLIILLSVIPFSILLATAGIKENASKVALHKIDKLWLDVACIGLVFVYIMVVSVIKDMTWDESRNIYMLFIPIAVVSFIWVEFALQFFESLARRFKTKTLAQTTFIGKVFLKIKRVIKKMTENIKLTTKVVLYGIAGIIGVMFYIAITGMFAMSWLGVFFWLGILVTAGCIYIWNYFREKEIIIEETKKIADGEVDNKIDAPMKFKSNRKLTESINGIGDGISKAVASSLKNERMKTELITNVSHDLKTPLTSIINYVDLLKTDGLDSEKASDYLDILDRKSQRLKNLTEDLVEASKLNSGVIELNIEKIDIVQLVNQSLAEYSERFEQSGLHVIKNITRDTIIVRADGRKTWRALDNLYSNVCKYAMPGTRVYIDIIDEENGAVVSIKNISAGALNFSADELMERFVRGDVSRTTEGSGLGLSIARSIMERQNGELKITLDGDLFKVEMKLITV
ncbi:MAG: HAMP domain-containing histidine kinase [Eubacterium sp.]|nr:HAMP domain-containing histidine kinase [Eubacterium sp.]